MNVPNPNSFVDSNVTSTSGINITSWNISAGSTDLNVYANAGLSSNYTYGDSSYIERKKSSIRWPKKKRGDLAGANDSSKRLQGCLEPVIFFRFLKKHFSSLQQRRLSSRLEKVSKILEIAIQTKQIALKDKLEDKFGPFLREQEMIACGFDQFVSKKTLELFMRSLKDRKVKLTPLKNYIRIIPKDVRKKLEKAEKSKLFDGYVILHTDPDDASVEKTREEKRDPILFGVIQGSDRYYFVADWIDEICDITMDTIIEALDLSKEEHTLESVQKELDKLLED